MRGVKTVVCLLHDSVDPISGGGWKRCCKMSFHLFDLTFFFSWSHALLSRSHRHFATGRPACDVLSTSAPVEATFTRRRTDKRIAELALSILDQLPLDYALLSYRTGTDPASSVSGATETSTPTGTNEIDIYSERSPLTASTWRHNGRFRFVQRSNSCSDRNLPLIGRPLHNLYIRNVWFLQLFEMIEQPGVVHPVFEFGMCHDAAQHREVSSNRPNFDLVQSRASACKSLISVYTMHTDLGD